MGEQKMGKGWLGGAMNWHALDRWTIWHFTLWHLGTDLLLRTGCEVSKAAAIMMCIGILWELFDYVFAGQKIFKDIDFDARGGCYTDLVTDAVGILTAVIL